MYSMQSTGRGFVDKAVGFDTVHFKFRPKELPLFAARVKVHPGSLSVSLVCISFLEILKLMVELARKAL